MTPLSALLARRIVATGPMTVADYMAECLLHPTHGYYTTRDPFGTSGDFTTAPEISQMFGELLGLALAQSWLDQGAPSAIALAELGPGRGTLMADALRATRAVPGFHAALTLHLVEASPTLRAAQSRALAAFSPEWHDTPDTLPETPLYLIANEFFDALPIRQFLNTPEGWRERVIGLAGDTLTFGLSPHGPCPAPRFATDPHGTLVEICPALPALTAPIATRIATHGGAAIFIDYGGWRSKGDTLQALRAHAPEDPLAHPGDADLTAHVDFEALALALTPLAISPLVTQGSLLTHLGVASRAARLAQGLGGAALESHQAATRRLTDPTEMGTVFKALAARHPGAPPVPGFP